MPKVEDSKYNILNRKLEKYSYEGKILSRSLSSRIMSSPKMTSFLIKIEPMVQNFYEMVGLIKKQINYRVDRNSKTIDN